MALRHVRTGFRLRLAAKTSVTVAGHVIDRAADMTVLLAIFNINPAIPVVSGHRSG